jgi:hypothetical protein
MCDSSHECCKRERVSLPFRVLELSRVENGVISVRLAQGAKRKDLYACLSHRWGASTLLCRTTRESLDGHLISVPWIKLPKTFQEAITVTVYLGLKYLWIDSLCIIQDDADDWKIQAAQMCNIYQGSYITIAASSSNDSSDGLFRKVPTIPVKTHDSRNRTYIRHNPIHPSYSIEQTPHHEHNFPLLSRGWVYQERLLSPRVVHFSHYELDFDCTNPYSVCECGNSRISFRKHQHNETLKESDLGAVMQHWHDIVREYSALQLSFQSDRLPAIAGIARQYGTAHKSRLGRYVAGLWEHTLAHDMIWLFHAGYHSQRPDSYCGPSWSWASTTGCVMTNAYSRARDDLEIEDFHIDLDGWDEFGLVKFGELTVKGYLLAGSLIWQEVDGRLRQLFQPPRAVPPKFFHIDYAIHSESPHHMPSGSPIYCLKTGFIGGGCHVCLILRAVESESRRFERAGIMDDCRLEDVNSWFEEYNIKETIKLV